jgi:ABC-type Mn2+/Zn2+ transport system ATPase subunit
MFKSEQYGSNCSHPIKEGALALEVKGLQFSYPQEKKPALQDVSFDIFPGEKVALVGPNGAGKSTLFRLVLGLVKMQKGKINVYGTEAHRCRHRVAIVPQKNSIDWDFPVSVEDVVMMGRYVHMGWFHWPRAQDKAKVQEAMKKMEIHNIRHKQIGELSGGQQQRVMLARTLAHDADLLLLDEPLNHVDIATQELIFHSMETLCEAGKSVMISTHDLGVLSMHFSRALFLDREVIADGTVEEVMTPENIARAYGFEFHKSKILTPWLNR